MMCILSKIYSALTWIRNLAYQRGMVRTVRLPGCVLSVGNIYVGGTGKTPFVVALAEHLRTKDKKVAILTRGYKSSLKRNQFVVLKNGEYIFGNHYYKNLGADEALMQSKMLPDVAVIVGAKRSAAAKEFLANLDENESPEVFILDDGFQHRNIERDLDIVLFKKELGIGNGRLLPAGPLREKVSSLLRADAVVVTRLTESEGYSLGIEDQWTSPIIPAPFTTKIMPLNQAACENSIAPKTTISVACSIANPEVFKIDLESLGLNCEGVYFGRDHEVIPLSELTSLALSRAPLFTTEKDYFRQAQDFDSLTIPVFTLKISLSLNDEIKNMVDKALL